MKASAQSLRRAFAALFDNAAAGGGWLSAETSIGHVLGKCTVALGRDGSGFFIEARQNMGWTDFDAVRELLLDAGVEHGVALLTPGPDGVSQPVLRVRASVDSGVARAWQRLSAALAGMDELLRKEG